MAGELTMAVVERETVTTKWLWRWRAQYSRCFTYPHSSSSSSSSSINDHADNSLLISKNIFKPTWLPTLRSSLVCLLPSDQSPELSVITVSIDDIVLEEHYVSKLHFAWPQVSCLSGFPTRGSLIIIASYTDCTAQKQKFALRFHTPSELESFVTSLEDIFSNKLPKEPSATEIISPISSQCEFIPPYRPDTSRIMNPKHASPGPTNFHEENPPYRPDTSRIMNLKHASPGPTNFHDENQHESQSQSRDIVGHYEANAAGFPPSFTSLLSGCSAEEEKNALAIMLAPEVQDDDLKAQIAKYMQDASFLDIVTKVNEVIDELGGDFPL